MLGVAPDRTVPEGKAHDEHEESWREPDEVGARVASRVTQDGDDA